MRMRSAALLASAALLLSGCAAAKRGAEDAVVVATFPIHLVTTPVGHLAEDWEKDPLSTAARLPVFLPLYALGDAFFTGVSAVDLALTPLYAPFPVRRLGIYRIRRFPPALEHGVAEDAGSALGIAVVVLAPIGACFLAWTDRAGWTDPCDPADPQRQYP